MVLLGPQRIRAKRAEPVATVPRAPAAPLELPVQGRKLGIDLPLPGGDPAFGPLLQLDQSRPARLGDRLLRQQVGQFTMGRRQVAAFLVFGNRSRSATFKFTPRDTGTSRLSIPASTA